MTEQYSIIAQQPESTVVARYERSVRTVNTYQSEDNLERAFIRQLQDQGYEYAKWIKEEKDLLANLRIQLEALNDVKLSDNEWKSLLGMIANDQLDIKAKANIIQRSEILQITREDGTTKNIALIDKRNIHRNRLQVINQYKVDDGTYKNRYDVTILVNGLPLVHAELKKRGVSIKQAFDQINRYQRDSFWAGQAMFDYVQIFIISNGTETKYYSNTTRYAAGTETQKAQRLKKTEGNKFEFTSYWSDQNNNLLPELADFTDTFLSKHTLLNILTRYCVLNTNNQLLVMRPYQITATEKILNRINQALSSDRTTDKWLGTKRAGGYIWHTTGSGKTLTSFKTAQLATGIKGIAKVLFVVDRKDLDYQTMKEYDAFEPNCANSNTSAAKLKKQLLSNDSKIIITTIQKLTNALKKHYDDLKEVLQQNIVIIFDECHRSQFGEMHDLITKRFKRYMIFGFTGTPIFPINAGNITNAKYRTTAEAFGGEMDENGQPTQALHKYTVVDAIRDKNVLKFHVDYERTMRMRDNVDSKEVWGIDTKKTLHSPERVRLIVQYILDNYDRKTKQNADVYSHSKVMNVTEMVQQELDEQKGKNLKEKKKEDKRTIKTRGFNSIFAVDSVDSALMYYNEFKRQMAMEGAKQLKIATIFTYSANEEEDEYGLLEDESPESAEALPVDTRTALDKIIREDYNTMFGTSYSTEAEQFQSYYKDVSLRVKQKEIDLLIVVGMFLTGFDAQTLNTLWVDKNLKMHGLIQAYSRTNRILNAVKDCGNIVCFRNLEKATQDALAVFGDKMAGGLVIMKTFNEYYSDGYKDERGHDQPSYVEMAEMLLHDFPVQDMINLLSMEEKKRFVKLLSAILRMRNLLQAFDEFTEDKVIISEGKMQDYLSWYNNYHEEVSRAKHSEKEDIEDDIEFEMELVKQVSIDIPYILELVQQYHDKNCKDKELLIKIKRSIDSSPDMRDKKELIEQFIERMTASKGDTDVTVDWETYCEEQKKLELQKIIDEEHLRPEQTQAFMKKAFENGYVTETGTEPAKILPPANPFLPDNKDKKQTVLDKLKAFFEKFANI